MKTTLSILMTASLLATGGQIMAIEQPKYRVIERNGDFEIRKYDSYLVAETLVRSEFESAGNEGFRRLFEYISGNNRAQSGISMTAPVSQVAERREIAMTAPVSQTAVTDGYWVSFVVPSEFTRETVPQPLDPQVRLREIPDQLVAAVRYAGFWGEDKYRQKEAALRDFMTARGMEAAGEPQFARYNPPFMPPFLRRNEIMIPLTTGRRPMT